MLSSCDFYLPVFLKGNFFFKAKKVGNPAVFLLPRSVSLALHEVHYAAVNNPPAPDISLSQIIFLHQTARLKLLRLPPATLLQPTVAFPEELRWEQWETSPFLHPPLSRLLSPIQKEVFPFRSCSRSADRQMKPDTEHSDWSDEENIFFFALCSIFGTKLCSFWIMNRSLCSPQKERISKLEVWHLVELNLRWCLDLDDKPKCGTPW